MQGSSRGRSALKGVALASLCLAASPALADGKPQPLKLDVIAPTAPVTGGPLTALSGNINAFSGNINAFSGNINAFSGNINAFSGNINAFSGNINAFSGNINAFSGNINAFTARYDPFWGDLTLLPTGLGANTAGDPLNYAGLGAWVSAFGGRLSALGATWGGLGAYGPATQAQYAAVGGQLAGVLADAQTFWGAAVTARTGKSFTDAVTKPVLARFGVSLSDPSTLAKLSPAQQSQLAAAFYDNLMEYTGTDHIDHWMNEVNWTPALTQIQGSGSNTVVGLLDFTVKNGADLQDNITSSTGVSTFSNGHGAGVASLIVAAHDGSGVMGIAPRASVVQYNPFDATGTTNWTDVQKGLISLGNADAGVINASLGLPGYTVAPDWNTVLSNKDVRNALKSAILVLAAGNDGRAQTANIEWDKNNAQFLVVGSTDSNLNISSFSNRPGSVCLTSGGKCGGDYLMNHFITASGEWLLVADDAGGFTRASGTSFAAPLVSGAIALLEDRWPWLSAHPKDIFTIVTKSAKDLGAPGPDPVYGVGQLDVTASQSPLSYDALQWWSPKAGVTAVRSLSDLQQTATSALRDAKQQATWEANGVYVYGFEQLGESYRDFAIPLSSKLVGQSAMSATGQQQQLQTYLTNTFKVWAAPPVSTAPASSTGTGKFAFLDFRSQGDVEAPVGRLGGLTVQFAATPQVSETGWRPSGLPFTSRLSLASADGGASLKFGMGDGAVNLGGVTGLSLHADYDPQRGGANPLLGFASGGAYGAVDYAIAPGLKLTAGATARDSRRDRDSFQGQERLAIIAAGDYQAQAQRVGLTWRAGARVQFTGGYTHLNETNGLLGVQSTDRADLDRGSQTDGVDFGADLALADGLSLSAAGTMGRTRSQAPGSQNLRVAGDGLSTSSFQVALTKEHLIGADRLRVSFAQPMHLEGGRLNYTGLQVVDRQTGELGLVTQSFDATQNTRPLVAELLYGRTVLHGAGELGLFTRAETRGVDAAGHTTPVMTTGARFRVSY